MNKYYNDFKTLSSGFGDFVNNYANILHKPQRNFLPSAFIGLLNTLSLNPSYIATNLFKYFPNIKYDSISKRIYRLLSNNGFNGHIFFNYVIKDIISSYKLKHSDKRVHVIIDHMYSKENYTILFISLRVVKFGITLYYKVFDGINIPEAYLDSTINDCYHT